jgi:hypothetical protein
VITRNPIGLLLAVCVALWADTSFGHDTTLQLSPNGVNDTARLQKALDTCARSRTTCRIVLARGVFHTDVLLVRGFKGRIRGQGRDETIIRPLSGVPLRSTARPFLKDPTLAQPYPVLLHFADGGDIEMSDLTLDFPADMQVAPWGLPYGLPNKLLAAIMVDGGRNDRARLELSRLAIRAPRSPTFGSNVWNAVSFEGQTRASDPYDATGRATPLASGELSAHDVSISGTYFGFTVRDLSRSQVNLHDNHLEDVLTSGISLADLSQSQAVVRKNRIAVASNGIRITRGSRFYGGVEQASKLPSTYFIAQNTVNVETGDGLVFIDATRYFSRPGAGIDRVLMQNNDVVLAPDAIEAVVVIGDDGHVTVAHNSLWGPAAFGGIYIDEGRGTRTWRNTFRDFGPESPDVILTPTTSDCRISEPGATVLDQGTGNRVDVGTR